MKKTLSILIASAILLGAYPLKNAISSNDNPTKPKNNIILAEKNSTLSINATIARNNKAGLIDAHDSAYSPLMSSSIGIALKANFSLEKDYKNLKYHWVTEEGSFFVEPEAKDVLNNGGPIVWQAIKDHKVADIKNSFNIVLEAIDMDSNKVVAKTSITINANDGFYKVQK